MGKTVTDTDLYTSVERRRMARIVFSLILVSLTVSFFSNTLIHQLCAPVIKFPYVDITYWIMHWLQVPEAITGNYIAACLFDAALFITCAGALLYPEKRVWTASFIILYFIYFITFNTYGTHHTNHKTGVLLIAIPFVVANNKSFNYLWQALRYFLLFAYSSAFLWKLFRFAWLQSGQGMLIMKKNVAAYLYFNPDTTLAHLYRWFIQHPAWVTGLFIAGMMAEGLFVIGFFTKRFDKFLFILSIGLPVGFWLIADAWFFELLILSTTLINYRISFRFLEVKYKKKGEVTPV